MVSTEWVRASLAPAIDVDGRPGGAKYGYKWWLYPNPTAPDRVMWAGSGFGGQFPIVIPEDDLIVVINQWNIFPGQPTLRMGATLSRIINAVQR